MPEEKMKFVGTYLTESLYHKMRIKCAEKDASLSKALLEMIIIFTKGVKLECEKAVVQETKPD